MRRGPEGDGTGPRAEARRATTGDVRGEGGRSCLLGHANHMPPEECREPHLSRDRVGGGVRGESGPCSLSGWTDAVPPEGGGRSQAGRSGSTGGGCGGDERDQLCQQRDDYLNTGAEDSACAAAESEVAQCVAPREHCRAGERKDERYPEEPLSHSPASMRGLPIGGATDTTAMTVIEARPAC